MIDVKVKTILNMKNYLGGLKEQTVQLPIDSTVEDLIYYLFSLYSDELKRELFDETHEVKKGIAMFVNGRNIFAKDALNTKLKEGDEFLIFPPVGGG